MNFDLEKDFENERWSLLALVDARKNLSEGSQSAIATDLMILTARELIRTYETLKGYWSRKPCRLDNGARRWANLSACRPGIRKPPPLLKSFEIDRPHPHRLE
jgi:hypothetical protein